MLKDNNGYIVVETVGTFIPFVLLVISILSLVNIVTMQARVHNALTQAANTIAAYSYVLYSADVSGSLMTINNKAAATKENIELVLSGIESLSKGTGSIADTGNRLLNSAETAISDPKATIQSLMNYGLGKIQGYASAELARPFIGRYLANADKSADEYLKTVRIVDGIGGIDLNGCVIVDGNGNIKLTAQYEIEYTFGALKFPFKPTLKVTQTAVTKAWLGGSGEGYRG